MRISRILTEQTLSPGREIVLNEAETRYTSQVLRLRSGQPLILFDGSGVDYEAELTRCDRRTCIVRVIRELSREQPSRLRLHLGIGISRGERMDFAIQKSVELGVTAITPLFTERGTVRLKAERLEKRLGHWRGVVRSACEQSGRNRLPVLHQATAFDDAISDVSDGTKLLMDPTATARIGDLEPAGPSVCILCGPEGGLSEREISTAAERGYRRIGFGPRVLRTETAGPALISALQTLWGDMG